ncbi:TPA: restriction endonuclease subunit S, partial [Staphylococcus aureus]|nr:restriction endonuclease subunit S [Staphylococcus aureus]
MSNTQKKNVPELRFPEFEGEWEEKKLGDLTDRVIRKN